MRAALTIALVLVATSASAQQVGGVPFASSTSPAPSPAPAWGPPPMPKPSYFPNVRPPLQQKREHRTQNRIFERLAYCALDLTPAERLRYCREI